MQQAALCPINHHRRRLMMSPPPTEFFTFPLASCLMLQHPFLQPVQVVMALWPTVVHQSIAAALLFVQRQFYVVLKKSEILITYFC